jgi:hypothetical protein
VLRTTFSACLLTLITLAGCATGQMDRKAEFTASSATSLVVFGVDVASRFKSPNLVFRKYDPATGQVDLAGVYYASPRTDKLTGGQKFAAFMTGQDSRPGGHDYFVINLPPGEWFLWCVSGFHNDGLGTSYSATTYFVEGTMLISSKPGAALYLGEFVLNGAYGQNLKLAPAPRNLGAAQAELDTFSGVQVKLVDLEPEVRSFTCVRGGFPKTDCDPKQIVVSR